MTNDLLLTTIDSRGVAQITLNRPEKHNAFDNELIGQLTELLVALENNENIRIIVLTGAGKSFSSGADLNWMKSMIHFNQEENRQDAQNLAKLMQQLYAFKKPTIAKVNGAAYGGALGLIACCDIAIGVNHAKFCFSEVKLGIAPAVISPYIIAAINTRQAKKLFLTGELFSANNALCIGLLHHTVDKEDLDDIIEQQIINLLKGGPYAQAEIKQLVHLLSTTEFANKDTQWKTVEIISKLRTSKEGQEGIAAFLNKRPANWIIEGK